MITNERSGRAAGIFSLVGAPESFSDLAMERYKSRSRGEQCVLIQYRFLQRFLILCYIVVDA
jgi:hypothetical protein